MLASFRTLVHRRPALLWLAAFPSACLASPTWFEVSAGDEPPIKSVLADLDSLKADGERRHMTVQVNFSQVQTAAGKGPFRSLTGTLEIGCKNQLAEWQEVRFYQEENGQGGVVALETPRNESPSGKSPDTLPPRQPETAMNLLPDKTLQVLRKSACSVGNLTR